MENKNDNLDNKIINKKDNEEEEKKEEVKKEEEKEDKEKEKEEEKKEEVKKEEEKEDEEVKKEEVKKEEDKKEEDKKEEDKKEEVKKEEEKTEEVKKEEEEKEEEKKKEDKKEEEKKEDKKEEDKKEEKKKEEKKEEVKKEEEKKEEKKEEDKKEEVKKEEEKKITQEKTKTKTKQEISQEFKEFILQKNEEELFCLDCGGRIEIDFQSSLGTFYSNFDEFENLFQYSLNCCLPCLEKIIKKFNNPKQKNEENIPKKIEQENNSEEDLNKEEAKLENEIKILNEQIKQSELKLKEEESKFQISIEKLKEATDEENKFLSDFRNLEKDAYILEKEKTYVENRNKLYETISKKFTYSNLLTDLFDISFDEKFGTINGCKFSDNLGSGDEVNAGWGYIAFLTKLLSIKYEFKSNNLKIYLEGNYSKMIEGDNYYELSFSSGSRTLEYFNEAMKKYLCYLKEFTNHLITYKKITIDIDDFKFNIDGDKINGKSIVFSEQTKNFDWPECMKYLLTILKFLITKTLGDENQSYRNLVEETLIINKQQTK